jgi:hypothetical protein
MDDFAVAVDRFNQGLLEFMKGDAEPALRLFSERDDVVLCNPFHPFAQRRMRLRERPSRLPRISRTERVNSSG